MKKQRTLWNDGTKTVAASLLSILMGVIFGGILLVVAAVCLKMPLVSAWEGFRIVLAFLIRDEITMRAAPSPSASIPGWWGTCSSGPRP